LNEFSGCRYHSRGDLNVRLFEAWMFEELVLILGMLANVLSAFMLCEQVLLAATTEAHTLAKHNWLLVDGMVV
jgi:hypothetical protein